jgi:hypothetical protein
MLLFGNAPQEWKTRYKLRIEFRIFAIHTALPALRVGTHSRE